MQAKGRKNTYEHEVNVLDMCADLEQPKDREDTHERDYENMVRNVAGGWYAIT